MHVLKVEITEPKYGSTKRKYLYLNNKPLGFCTLKDAQKIDTRIRKMLTKYINQYDIKREMEE